MASLPIVLYSSAAMGLSAGATSLFVGASLYDVQTIKHLRPLKRQPGTNRFRRRPVVSTVVIAGRGDNKAVEATIDSLLQANYRKSEIVVIDNGAGLKLERQKNMRIIKKRTVVSYEAALTTARTAVSGELVIVLRPGYRLVPQTIRNIVQYFLADENNFRAVAAVPYKDTQAYSITSQLAGLGNGLRRCYLKARSLRPGKYFLIEAPLKVYSRNSFRGKSNVRLKFISSLQVFLTIKEKPTTPIRHRLVQWLLWLGVICSQVYLGYVAIALHVSQPLLITILFVIAFSLLVLISDDQLALRQKLRSLMLLPFWYGAGCLYALLRVLKPIAIVRRIRIRFSLAP